MKQSSPAFIALLFQAALTLSSPAIDPKTHRSDHPIFILHNITYYSSTVYSTPAHLAVADASIQFNLTNTAVSYTTECSAFLDADPAVFYGNQNFSCKVPASVDPEASTNFTYAANGAFEIYSTWSHGSYGDERTTYLGVGNGTATLACNSTSWTNTNWTLGQIYSTYDTTCSPAQLEITPTVSHSKTER
ncbi:hypothetical protein N431DRAFT_381161 [Stipitochalara longipes BDJ]|nr:hypothetical protein N431DRAFT_381161 [Stipitochalara longipes BDJ]